MKRYLTHGFTLLEMSIAIAISALIGLAVWKFLATTTPVATGNATQQSLLLAQDAIEGFAQANFRMPCPASSAGGSEDCDSGISSGWLPARTLGLSNIHPLHYGVATTLMNAANRYIPDLPNIPDPDDPTASTSTGYTGTTNGLDLCYTLQTLTTTVSAGGVTAAYALADAGANRTFDGADAGGFALPGAPYTTTFDDSVAAAGVGELFTQLGCPVRLAAANSAARSAYAAYDLARMAVEFRIFRDFVVRVRQYDLDAAQLAYDFALLDEALELANTAFELAMMDTESAGTTTVSLAGVAAEVATVATLAYFIYEAEGDLEDAEDNLAAAEGKDTAAVEYQAWAINNAARLLAQAKAVDAQGLLQ